MDPGFLKGWMKYLIDTPQFVKSEPEDSRTSFLQVNTCYAVHVRSRHKRNNSLSHYYNLKRPHRS